MDDFSLHFGRDEFIAALDNMKVSIPPRTKLPDDALDKRLKQALNAAQMFQKYITKSTFNVSKLPIWPKSLSVYDNIRRGDLNEALTAAGARVRGNDPFPLYKNAFMDLRQTLMSVAKSWDSGVKIAIVQDRNHETCAINLRVLNVHKIDNNTPVLLVLYMITTKADPWPGVRWVQEQQRRGPGVLPNISASDIEIKMLAKLLAMNEKHLPTTFKPQRLGAEDGFKPSFLLPIGPLSFEDLGKLNVDYGCAVCGEKSSKRCAQCQSVSYCSAECQRVDWTQHKQACRSLKGGAWLTLPFVTTMPQYEGGVTMILNRFNSAHPEEPRESGDTSVPSNIHSDKVFLIKIQIGSMGGVGNLLIYDRQRSMQVYFLQSADHELFKKFREEIEGPRGGYNGLKMYRWAKRSGDFQLSVCLDRAPQEEVKW